MGNILPNMNVDSDGFLPHMHLDCREALSEFISEGYVATGTLSTGWLVNKADTGQSPSLVVRATAEGVTTMGVVGIPTDRYDALGDYTYDETTGICTAVAGKTLPIISKGIVIFQGTVPAGVVAPGEIIFQIETATGNIAMKKGAAADTGYTRLTNINVIDILTSNKVRAHITYLK